MAFAARTLDAVTGTKRAAAPFSTACRRPGGVTRSPRAQPASARIRPPVRERTKNPDTVKSDKRTSRDRVAEPVDDAVSSPGAYLGLAVTLALLSVPSFLIPHTSADIIFGQAALPHDVLHEPLFRIVGTGLAQGAAVAAALRVGAERGGLNKVPYQRLELGLVVFATLQVLLQLTNISQPNARVLTSAPFWASSLVFGLTVLVAWGGFGKDSEGLSLKRSGPLPILKRFQDDTAALPEVATATSTAYSLLAAAFFAAGLGYLIAPETTLQGVFSNVKGDEIVFLWRTAGVALVSLVALSSYTLKEAAQKNRLGDLPYRLLNAGLAAGAGVHLVVLAPFFLEGSAGPLAGLVAGTWLTAGIVSGRKLLQPES